MFSRACHVKTPLLPLVYIACHQECICADVVMFIAQESYTQNVSLQSLNVCRYPYRLALIWQCSPMTENGKDCDTTIACGGAHLNTKIHYIYSSRTMVHTNTNIHYINGHSFRTCKSLIIHIPNYNKTSNQFQ